MAFSVFFIGPQPAYAGFFSNLIKFFSGGPKEENSSPSAAVLMPILGSSNGGSGRLEGVGGPVWGLDAPLPVIQESALIAPRNPIGVLPSPYRDQIVLYTVQPGDTPGGIAGKFGVSLNTLLWANSIRNPNLIKIGDELIILPVSGVRYEVEKGDTVWSIAKKFKGDASEIINFNGLAVGEPLETGSVVIIPDGEAAVTFSTAPTPASRFSSLPELAGYFLRPILGGRRSRGLHGFNGVDLAQSCGSPVLASADGAVIIARNSGWNGGYGRYIVISHPNGVQTLYAHLHVILASVGQSIAQGSQVATIGSTGNSTGCHVHFETRGAKNPF